MATNYERAFERRPAVYAAWQQLNDAIKAGMDLRRYELATLAAARRLRSSYCCLAHGTVLAERFGEPVAQIAADHRAAGLDEIDVAVMDLAEQVADDATSVSEADLQRLRDLGLSPEIALEDWGAAGDELGLDLLSAVAGRMDVAPAAAEPRYRRRLYDAVAAAFRGAADQAPLVLVLEDLHWAGAATVELLRYLVEHATEARILILATHRTSAPDRSGSLGEVIASLHRLDGVRRLDLAPLTTDDITPAPEPWGTPSRPFAT